MNGTASPRRSLSDIWGKEEEEEEVEEAEEEVTGKDRRSVSPACFPPRYFFNRNLIRILYGIDHKAASHYPSTAYLLRGFPTMRQRRRKKSNLVYRIIQIASKAIPKPLKLLSLELKHKHKAGWAVETLFAVPIYLSRLVG